MSSGGENENEFAQMSISFAFDLYNKVIEHKKNENVVVSPFSIQTAVALLFTRAFGETADEIVQGLRLFSSNHSVVTATFRNFLNAYYETTPFLTIANKIYVKSNDCELDEEFRDVIVKSFFSEIENIDYSDKNLLIDNINKWTNERTEGKIAEMINFIHNEDFVNLSLFLINANHFKGQWVKSFDTVNTVMYEFWISDSEAIEVPMMVTTDVFKYADFSDLEAFGLEMSFADSSFSMFFLMPYDLNKLAELEKKLPDIDFFELTNRLEPRMVYVKMPKFEMEHSEDIRRILENMDVKQIFTDEAQFQEILKTTESLKVSEIFHKVLVEISEEGVELPGSIPETYTTNENEETERVQYPYFTANTPFIYMIIDDQRNVFFIGRYSKPKAYED